MGKKRRESDHRLRLRLSKPRKDRETLLPCDACDGNGMRLLPTTQPYKYRRVRCAFCDGTGHVDRHMAAVYARWKSIKAANKC